MGIPTRSVIGRIQNTLSNIEGLAQKTSTNYDLWVDAETGRWDEIDMMKAAFEYKLEIKMNELQIMVQGVKEQLPHDRTKGQQDGDMVGTAQSDMFMKKVEWPEFKSGNRWDYPTFRRDWRLCVGNYPVTHQIREIRTRIPDTVEPEVKVCLTMDQVWRILDNEYGRPEDVSRESLNRLRALEPDGQTDGQKFMALYHEYTKVRNDLKEVKLSEDLNTSEVLGMLASKLPNEATKTRWVTQRAYIKRSARNLSAIETWDEFMEDEKEIQRDLVKMDEDQAVQRTIAQGASGAVRAGGGVRCFNCTQLGHVTRDCTTPKKMPPKAAPLNILLSTPGKPCPACRKQHEFALNGELRYKSRLSCCPIFQDMSVDDRADCLVAARGCYLCTDWTGDHTADKR
jgi:hypothetical protein